ncbi:MAG: cohesin domain-containing protein [Anaerolineae bacterium]
MRYPRAPARILILVVLCALPIGLARAQPVAARDLAATITFEEAIPQSDTLRTQYCSDPATNKGVEFIYAARIFQPPVQTASPTHALTNNFPGNEFGEYDQLAIRFTKDQAMVGMKVGLTRSRSYPVTARLTAYSSTTPGTGQVAQSTLNLGSSPTPITQNISVAAPSGNIRSVVLALVGPAAGNAEFETIDDLTFSSVGPPCVSDTASPTVQITRPATDGTVSYTQHIEMAFKATDNETGIAKVKVAFLDTGGNELSSFYACGSSSPCPYDVDPYVVSEDFYTELTPGTAKIRVTAWDFANHSAQAERTITLTSIGSLNLWAMGMEITQAIQPWVAVSSQPRSAIPPTTAVPLAWSAPFVAGKRAVVRVYPGIEVTGQVTLTNVVATLTCQDSVGAPCPDSPTPALSQTISVSSAFNNDLNTLRSDPSRTWNFVLPDAWTQTNGPIKLTAHITAPLGIGECDGCNDGANSMTVSGVIFTRTDPLKLTLLWGCIRRKATDPTTTCDLSPLTIYKDVFQTAGALFVEAYPVAPKDIQVTLHNPQTTPFDGNLTRPDGAMTSDRMSAFHGYLCDLVEKETGKKHADIPINKIYFGIVPPPVTAWLGLGSRNCAIAKLDPASLDGDIETSAEEVGHALGRPHESCDHGEGGCEPAPGVFPCPHGGICTYGFNTATSHVIPPGTPAGLHAHDFMSYGGDEQWVSPYTYSHLFDALHTGALKGETPETPAAVGEEEVLWVSGSVGPGAGTAQISPIYQVRGPNASRDPGSGPYGLELQDGAGQVLFARNFDPQPVTGDPPDPSYQPPGRFSDILPFNPSAARLVLKQGSVVLAQRARTPNRPAVTVTAPTAGQTWDASGSYRITWQANDADNDALVYLIQYSADAGATWSTLAADWTATSLDVNSATLAGSDNALIRVLATDGFNTGIGQTGPFHVGRKRPLAWITYPRTVLRRVPQFVEGSPVVFEGNATDWEEGPLGDTSLAWFSNRDGFLGAGHRLDATHLSPGVHTITLQARDSTPMTSTVATVVEVVPRTNTQPTAEAGPGRNVGVSGSVRLDGSGSSDPDGDRLTYHWSVVSQPPDSTPVFSDASAVNPDFSANIAGDYEVALVVDDGKVSSLPDRATVHVGGTAGARLYVAPAGSSVTVGNTVTVDLRVDSIENLYGVQLELGFDPQVLEVVDAYPTLPGVQISDGDFLIPDASILNRVDNSSGTIEYAVSLRGSKPGVSGSGTLARITFRGRQAGVSRIMFTHVVLSDPQSAQIAVTTEGGVVVVERAAGVVVGRVILERRSSNSGASVCIGHQCTTTGADGGYVLTEIPAGPATISVSRPSYLRTERGITVPTGLLPLPDVTLLAGDVNQSDRIDQYDAISVGLAWNATPADTRWDERSDITADRSVNILDMVGVQYNWNSVAPGPWGTTEQTKAAFEERVPQRPEATTQVVISPTLTTLSAVGNTVEVRIRVQDVTRLYGGRVQLTFNPSVLRVQDADPRPGAPGVQIQPGDFLDPMNQFVLINEADNTRGTIDFAVTQLYPATARTGSGTLATVTFEAIKEGRSPIHLADVGLGDDTQPDPIEIPVSTRDGQVVVGLQPALYLPSLWRSP